MSLMSLISSKNVKKKLRASKYLKNGIYVLREEFEQNINKIRVFALN